MSGVTRVCPVPPHYAEEGGEPATVPSLRKSAQSYDSDGAIPETVPETRSRED